MIMVKAGDVVDDRRSTTSTLLVPGKKGDIVIIDGGNSLFTDSNRRTRRAQPWAEKGILLYRDWVFRAVKRVRLVRPVDHARWQSPRRGLHVKEIFQA